MKNKLIIRLSNEVGNQMFMYASAYAIAKELNRTLCVDSETAFLSKKNVSKFGLDSFEITSEIAPDTLKFKNLFGYIKRKFLINTESLRKKKMFYIEKKNNRGRLPFLFVDGTNANHFPISHNKRLFHKRMGALLI